MLDLEATVNMTQDSAGAELTCGFQFFVNINDDTNYLRVPIPYLETAGNVRNVRILIDASIVEVYLDGGDTSLGGTTSYFYYPSSADYANFGIYMENKMISINSDSSSSRERSGDVDDDDYTTSFCDFEVHTVWSMDPFKFNASLYVF